MRTLSKKGGIAYHRQQLKMSAEEELAHHAYLLDHESICGTDKPRGERPESKRMRLKKALRAALAKVLVFH